MNRWRMLPFRFKPLDGKVLLVNEVGEFVGVSESEWSRIKRGQIAPDEELYFDLSAKDFICSEYSSARINRIAAKYRTKKKFLFESTALHMFILTHRCNQSCLYCHASSIESPFPSSFEDMPPDVARKCVDRAFESPATHLKFEFQGGEPSLNFETLKVIVEYVHRLNRPAAKKIEFVICTNLTCLSNAQLAFLHDHAVQISTSLDGPAHLHDTCRKTGTGQGTYTSVITGIKKARAVIGEDELSALLTVTRYNVNKLKDVVDEYLAQGFNSIFIRRLNPLGMAERGRSDLHYSDETFLDAYLDVLEYILNLNRSGKFFVEEFAAILLGKILTPFASGFVDMQSPAGTGLSAVIYDVDGKVFVSDEARMLYRSKGTEIFCLGNACSQTRKELFSAPIMKLLMESSTLECQPGCAWCAYLPYCGSDPVRNFVLHGRLTSFKPHDPWCSFYKRVFDKLFSFLLSDDEETIDVLWSWTTGRQAIGPEWRRHDLT